MFTGTTVCGELLRKKMQLEKLIHGTDTHSKSKWDEKPE